jgi:hypothetical protein
MQKHKPFRNQINVGTCPFAELIKQYVVKAREGMGVYRHILYSVLGTHTQGLAPGAH